MLTKPKLLTEYEARITRDASGCPTVDYIHFDTGKAYARFETNKWGNLVGTRGRAAIWGTDAIVPNAITATNAELYKLTRAAIAMRIDNCVLMDA